jgi:hypothetical protein
MGEKITKAEIISKNEEIPKPECVNGTALSYCIAAGVLSMYVK